MFSRCYRLSVFGLAALGAALYLSFGLSSALALDVRQTDWGFDGQVVPQRFNLFSVLVDNPAANPFEGQIELRKMAYGKQVDAVLIEPVYLAPYSSRWIQFYPYVKSEGDTFEVSWGKGAANQISPPSLRAGKPAAILLDDPDAIPQAAGAIRRLPDNLFPPHSTATDCLAAVVLDHVPRWDLARQKSFMEWLRRGGRVYLLRDTDGKYPEFSGELKLLNGAEVRLRLGSGIVHRLERNRRALDPSFVEQIIIAGTDPGAVAADLALGVKSTKSSDPAGNADAPDDEGLMNYKWDFETKLLGDLKKMSVPDHHWLFIHFLAWIYLGLVFPGCFAIGRKYGADFRVTFGALLATIFVFSLAFLFVGRRGYNEATVLHSVAIVRQPAAGLFDVTEWSNAFVVHAGDYSFTHDGSGRIYSSCQEYEMVPGEIRNGADAHFLADMPPYSSRAFSHRGLLAGEPIEVEMVDWSRVQAQNPQATSVRSAVKTGTFQSDRALAKLTLRKGSHFPTEHLEMYALFGRRLYRLKETADRLELSSEAGTLAGLLTNDQFYEFGALNTRAPWQPARLESLEPTAKQVFRSLFNPLVARSLDLVDRKDVEQFVLPFDRVRLLIYAPLPAEYRAKDERFVTQDGYLLYSLDVFEPESR
jgi:hypothetical protein